jgi:hypothetical protein
LLHCIVKALASDFNNCLCGKEADGFEMEEDHLAILLPGRLSHVFTFTLEQM